MTYITLLVLVAAASAAGFVFMSSSEEGPMHKKTVLFVGVGAAIAVTLYQSLAIVPTGTIRVASMFGNIKHGFYDGTGIQIVNPLLYLEELDAKRVEIDLQYADEKNTPIVTGTKDDNFLTVDAIFAYQIDKSLAYKVLATIGSTYPEKMRAMAMVALRQGVAKHTWTESVKQSSKTEDAILAEYKSIVSQQLIGAGFSKEEAANAFIFYPVQLRKAVPDEKVLNATANKLAEQENLATMATLTEQAKEIANRRREEGSGLRKLVLSLTGKPDDTAITWTPEQLAMVINAIANQERATGMLAIANGDPKRPVTIIFNGDTAANVTVPASK